VRNAVRADGAVCATAVPCVTEGGESVVVESARVKSFPFFECAKDPDVREHRPFS